MISTSSLRLILKRCLRFRLTKFLGRHALWMIWISTVSTLSTSRLSSKNSLIASSVRSNSSASEPSMTSLIEYMKFSWPRFSPFGAIALAIATLLYPGIVYVTRTVVPPLTFVAVALALIGLRLATLRSPIDQVWRAPFVIAAALIALLAALDTPLAVKAYPVAVSLA